MLLSMVSNRSWLVASMLVMVAVTTLCIDVDINDDEEKPEIEKEEQELNHIKVRLMYNIIYLVRSVSVGCNGRTPCVLASSNSHPVPCPV